MNSEEQLGAAGTHRARHPSIVSAITTELFEIKKMACDHDAASDRL
jgi:hypothetical protein